MRVSERRKFFRFDTDCDGLFRSKDNLAGGLISFENISREGLRGEMNVPAAPGSFIELEICLPAAIMPIFAAAEVVWCRKDEQQTRGYYRAGLKLKDIEYHDREQLLKYGFRCWDSAKRGQKTSAFAEVQDFI